MTMIPDRKCAFESRAAKRCLTGFRKREAVTEAVAIGVDGEQKALIQMTLVLWRILLAWALHIHLHWNLDEFVEEVAWAVHIHLRWIPDGFIAEEAWAVHNHSNFHWSLDRFVAEEVWVGDESPLWND